MTSIYPTLLLAYQIAAQIDGKLIHALTNKPIPRANIQVIDPTDSRRVAETTSNAEGAFHFENLPTGRFKLATTHSRFVPYSLPGVLDLQPETKIEALTLKLTPASALNGRVVDSDGDPLQGAQVTLYRASPYFTEEYWLPAGGASSDDRGIFRIPGVAPGQYLVSCQKRESSYRQTYYPNAASASDAQPLQVQPGSDVEDLVFTLPTQKTGAIRGSFTTPGRAWIVADAPPSERRIPYQRDYFFPIHPQTGAFEIRGLDPGDYRFSVLSNSPGQPTRILANADLSFTGQDIDNLVFQPLNHTFVNGKVVYEGTGRLSPRILFMYPEFGRNSYMQPATPDPATGAFTLSDIIPGHYRLVIDLGKSKAFVKSVRQGSPESPREMLGQLFDITAAAQDPLTITISTQVATLSGKVTRSDPTTPPGTSPPGVVIAEALDRKPDIGIVFGVRRPLPPVNQEGAYEISNLAPGRYRLYALESIHPNDAYDARLLKRLAPHATEVTLAEGETKELNLKQIPTKLIDAALHQR